MERDSIRTGEQDLEIEESPMPSYPSKLLPMLKMVPLSVKRRVWYLPHETDLILRESIRMNYGTFMYRFDSGLNPN